MRSLKVLALKEPLPEFVIASLAKIEKVDPANITVEYATLTDSQSHLDKCWRVSPDFVVMHLDQVPTYLWVDAKRTGYRHLFYADHGRPDHNLYELKLIGYDPD